MILRKGNKRKKNDESNDESIGYQMSAFSFLQNRVTENPEGSGEVPYQAKITHPPYKADRGLHDGFFASQVSGQEGYPSCRVCTGRSLALADHANEAWRSLQAIDDAMMASDRAWAARDVAARHLRPLVTGHPQCPAQRSKPSALGRGPQSCVHPAHGKRCSNKRRCGSCAR